MGAPEEFRSALVAGDYRKLRTIWGRVSPHLDQPKTDREAEALMHRARTEAESVPLKLRLYSHSWLLEHCIPSGLPDELRPKPERVETMIVKAVGISVNSSNPLLRPAMEFVRLAMEGAVEEAAADGKLDDSNFVRARMAEARQKELAALLGKLTPEGSRHD